MSNVEPMDDNVIIRSMFSIESIEQSGGEGERLGTVTVNKNPESGLLARLIQEAFLAALPGKR